MKVERKKSIEALAQSIAPGLEVTWTTDDKNNDYGWVELPKADDLVPFAKGLVLLEARIMTITAHAPENPSEKGFFEVCYHFIIKGTALTVRVIPEGTTPTVPSITPWHKAADWAEREVHELYCIEVANHPNPKPLFLNNETQPLAMERLVPLSTMGNGACTNTLWEKIMGDKSGEAVH